MSTLGLLAFLGGSAELHDGRDVDGLDEAVEVHGGRVVGAGVGGADGGVEAVGGLLVGEAETARSASAVGAGMESSSAGSEDGVGLSAWKSVLGAA